MSVLFILLYGLVLAGCHSTNYLASYDFHDHNLGVLSAIPPRPDIFTGDFFYIDPDRPARTLLRLGSSVVKEAEAERTRVRLDSAMHYVDVAARITDNTLERSALYLGAHPTKVPEDADFLLDVRISEYGINAKSWEAQAYFMIKAEMLLIDAHTGRRIWKGRVRAEDPIMPAIFGPGTTIIRNVVTAEALARLSVEEAVVALEHLADYAAGHLTYTLQRDLDRALP